MYASPCKMHVCNWKKVFQVIKQKVFHPFQAVTDAHATLTTKDNKDLYAIFSDIFNKYSVFSVGSDSKDVNKVKADIKYQLKEK
ncbi:hypothetical protein P5663_20795 (plasmid) [Priestia flexa]|uniref:hypothetical protein n=1 Tax=Priestia flexa TaxID=86664 RepID=UPI00240D6EB1|nr:hypothetical protein [Priestia flexa]WEZ10350.1 hypothetical protein P5663_20795 [Priestia flexa]